MAATSRAFSTWKLFLAVLITFVVAIASSPSVDISRSAETLGASGYRFKNAERCLMRKINNIRGSHGLNRLRPDKQLAYVARRHANAIASSRYVFHDGSVGSKVTRWNRLAQNTGRGASCRSLTRAFMRSSKHRVNILGTFRFMGLGTQKVGDNIYVQQLFESRRDPGNIYQYP